MELQKGDLVKVNVVTTSVAAAPAGRVARRRLAEGLGRAALDVTHIVVASAAAAPAGGVLSRLANSVTRPLGMSCP